MKKPLILLFVLAAGLLVQAQTSYRNSMKAYLGHTCPTDTPKISSPGLLAPKGMFTIDRIAFSPDEREIYYCVNVSPRRTTIGLINKCSKS
jgi:hypothetical protein